jgi:hypothetical protein
MLDLTSLVNILLVMYNKNNSTKISLFFKNKYVNKLIVYTTKTIHLIYIMTYYYLISNKI